MSASCHGLARVAVFAVAGATAVSLSACGTSNKSSPTSTSTSTSTVTSTSTSAAPNAEAKVSGLIASVAGNSIQVTKEDNGTAAVNFTSTTKITEAVPAGLPDVTPGSCVSVKPTEGSAPGQPVTAASVKISQSVNGACPKPHQPTPGGSSSPAPSLPPSQAPAKPALVRGSVASVSGNTINVTGTDPSGNTTQTTVTVDDKTKYTKQSSANTDAITPGKCLSARGTNDSGGALQATSIQLRQAVDGKCGKPKQPGHGG
ncbi:MULTISPECIES: DUF5666 domain-containing protein [Mycobacterium avium complex (MAC)]|jgi:hypothetical protein|uniref:DUF5666 domain-containing protein n=3 Tax=Mycobacterium avium complex (MAC) TaxID=120793 RepID=A0AAW5RY56_MYCBC|nr:MULTISPECIES: DUF5666 domain-containing protein [Mycobacterium avium complex (MAC)]ETA94011.1 hypothetical protein O984_07380 [Mycobacterium avium 05-4293]ETB08451.1 hypothetical protein P863_14300 [Mycobacterium avium subsp. silvaticum ATCC 49884]ETB15759.1 hypothetical protein O972_15150 [Mycobacterium avium subsp. avium 10-9275]ETB20058.1 hypothetical protein O973_14440 [Mycobacterium avium subsp. avium 11-4751]ETB23844.1 hypothetical protein O983_14675 [Mycobacterium avium 09-5983]ETB2